MTAVVPCHVAPPAAALLRALRRHVGGLLVVDDGMPPAVGARLRHLARDCGADVLTLPRNRGKGHVVAAGIAALLAAPRPPAGVLVADADGQHPPGAAPALIAASARGELVVGDRFGDLRRMPVDRRLPTSPPAPCCA